MSSARSRPGSRRRVVRAALALVWLVVVLLAVGYWMHQRFVATVRRAKPPTWLAAAQGAVSPDLVRRVGFVANGKKSSFLAKPARKPTGVTRICAFGDSFTHGDEVSDANDYPTLLQEQLDERAPGRFEVLNFGVSSYGFHQAFMLWEALGPRYGCDEVLLGPATFFPDRDTSFNHAGSRNPYYLHARYVLDGDGVRLVEVVGDSLEERFEEYVRFVPHLDYARYDRTPPTFLRALLRPGQTVPNPFYYDSGSMSDEARETYRRLLERMAKAGVTVRIGFGHDANRLVEGDAEPSIDRFVLRMPRSFPYVAPHGHQGPIGNQLIAAQFAERIAPREGDGPEVLRLRDQAGTAAGSPSPARRALSAFADARVEIDGVSVGSFVRGKESSKREGHPALLRSTGAASLLVVGGPSADPVTGSSSVFDGCFLPSASGLSQEPKVCLTVFHGGTVAETCDGRVRFPDPTISLGVLEIDGVDIVDSPLGNEENRLAIVPQSPERQASLRGASRVAITVDGVTVLTGVPDAQQKVRLTPGPGGCFRVRANEDGLVDVDRLGTAGTVDLVLRGGGSGDVRVPLARWEKRPLAAADGGPAR